jgi:hypothetical protein
MYNYRKTFNLINFIYLQILKSKNFASSILYLFYLVDKL